MELTVREKAEKAKFLYIRNEISREDMEKDVKPFVNEVNAKAVEVAKKFGVKPKKISIPYFLRQ